MPEPAAKGKVPPHSAGTSPRNQPKRKAVLCLLLGLLLGHSKQDWSNLLGLLLGTGSKRPTSAQRRLKSLCRKTESGHQTGQSARAGTPTGQSARACRTATWVPRRQSAKADESKKSFSSASCSCSPSAAGMMEAQVRDRDLKQFGKTLAEFAE